MFGNQTQKQANSRLRCANPTFAIYIKQVVKQERSKDEYDEHHYDDCHSDFDDNLCKHIKRDVHTIHHCKLTCNHNNFNHHFANYQSPQQR